MTSINSRFLAIATLHQLTSSNKALPVLFDNICGHHSVKAMDRAFAMNTIYGVLRHRDYLDFLISRLSRTPLKRLHPLVHNALLVGLYQLMFLSRTPDSAAVNETVNAAKQAKVPKHLHGFINGILREAIRQKNSLPAPDDAATLDPPILNHPRWMLKRWQDRYGNKAMCSICFYNNRQPQLCLRVDVSKTTRNTLAATLKDAGIEATIGTFSDTAIFLPHYQGRISELPGYPEHLFHVQGETAQLAAPLLAPFVAGNRYLDTCAGLGGKTHHLLALTADCKAQLVAVEPELQRNTILQTSLEGISEGRLLLFPGNLKEYAATGPEPFDAILVDAPCSGTGVIGRQPDIRWRRSCEDLLRYQKTQLELLELAAKLLSKGGVLVYATCSIEREENLDVVHMFLDRQGEFSLTSPAPFLPEQANPLIRDDVFAPLPSDGVDGFFAARLVRK